MSGQVKSCWVWIVPEQVTSTLHSATSLLSPWQLPTPTLQLRVLKVSPVPQVTGHVDQSDQGPHCLSAVSVNNFFDKSMSAETQQLQTRKQSGRERKQQDKRETYFNWCKTCRSSLTQRSLCYFWPKGTFSDWTKFPLIWGFNLTLSIYNHASSLFIFYICIFPCFVKFIIIFLTLSTLIFVWQTIWISSLISFSWIVLKAPIPLNL